MATITAPAPARPVTRTLRASPLDWLRRLSYYATVEAAGKRDLRVDLLRGFCVFAMVVDHLGGDSWLYAVTGGNRFYVSAAEGFIFISGVVMGQAYRSKVERNGLIEAMLEALRRARTLYLATVGLTLIFSALFLYTDIQLWTGRDYGLDIDQVPEIVVGALTLHYTYHGTDILAMYAILVLAAPMVLLLLATGRWPVVLAISWLWWGAYQVYPEQTSLPWYVLHGENFPIGAWQVLFVSGMVLGFHRAAVTRFLRHWRPLRVVLVGLGLAMTMAFLSVFLSVDAGTQLPAIPFGLFDADPDVLADQFFKVPLRPWRMVAFVSVAIVAYAGTTYLWRPLRKVTGWLLMPFGQHALYSYIMHFFLILLAFNLDADVLAAETQGVQPQVHDTLLQVAVVLLLWAMVRRRFLFGIVPN